jgi:hypothetical protein
MICIAPNYQEISNNSELAQPYPSALVLANAPTRDYTTFLTKYPNSQERLNKLFFTADTTSIDYTKRLTTVGVREIASVN